jgi:hypothetical protein
MIAKLFDSQRPLMVAGVVSFVLFMAMIALAFADATEVLGINRWIKPMKFYISISIFVWTMAVYLNYLNGRERFSRGVSWAFIAIFAVEMAVITGQAARGTTSHFNVATPMNGILYGVMGAAIALSTLLVGAVAYRYFTDRIDLPPALVWGMRLGLIVFLLGCIQGGYMSAQPGHAVGLKDGGAGLPLVNWSTEGGDLRVAHFLGLHGLQAVPLFALVLARIESSRFAVAFTIFFAIAYTAAFTIVFAQALAGRPLLAGL